MNDKFLINFFQDSIQDIEYTYSNFSGNDFSVWNLVCKGFLFKLFREFSDTNAMLNQFSKKVDETLQARSRIISTTSNNPTSISGKILAFDPSLTMFDGVAEKYSKGFFDKDDVPPPEFWLGMKDDLLYSFIPDEFIERANRGIECALGGSLEWVN